MAAAAVVDLGFFCTQPDWTASDKEELLGALWAAHEKARLAENVRKCRYKSRRYAKDEHFGRQSIQCQRLNGLQEAEVQGGPRIPRKDERARTVVVPTEEAGSMHWLSPTAQPAASARGVWPGALGLGTG